MAEPWIKVECGTPTKEEVIEIARLLSIHPLHAFGLCFNFWCWCDAKLSDGKTRIRTDVAAIDYFCYHEGFGRALELVGWLKSVDGFLVVPNFDRHLGQSAKKRAVSQRKQQKYRENIKESVTTKGNGSLPGRYRHVTKLSPGEGH